jgi:alkylated DNA repair protein (DNA oxidative demethylase)
VRVPSWLTSGQQHRDARLGIHQDKDERDDAPVVSLPARFAFHGVTKIHSGTSPAGCGLTEGRINIPMRVTGQE